MITTTLDRELAEQRLQSAITLVESLFSVDWPYQDSSNALKLLHEGFKSANEELNALDADAGQDVVYQHCLNARTIISEYSGFIGFIVRSADLRNSFEIYSPIKELGEKLLGSQINVILGSEWNYSPYIYPIPTSVLENFILVGLPAAEAQNALLVPVAGHELGHAIWRRTEFRHPILATIQKATIDAFADDWEKLSTLFGEGTDPHKLSSDLVARSVWSISFSYAARQCEEVFCDLIGLYVFGQSFLHSFRYLLSPDTSVRLSKHYPSNRTRAEFLAKAASVFEYELPEGFVNSFREPDKITDPLLVIADRVTAMLIDELAEQAKSYCSDKNIPPPNPETIRIVSENLQNLSPSSGEASISEILNAAWDIRLNIGNWEVPGVPSNRKFLILNDLVLKSFEVLEWKRRPREN